MKVSFLTSVGVGASQHLIKPPVPAPTNGAMAIISARTLVVESGDAVYVYQLVEYEYVLTAKVPLKPATETDRLLRQMAAESPPAQLTFS